MHEAARLVGIGFDGTALADDARELLAIGAGAVVLFARNAGSRDEVRALCAAIRAAAPRPVVIAVDQEGGDVMRLRDGFTAIPSMRDVGRTRDVERARAVGRALADDLAGAGIDLDLAPVLDVDSNPANPVIGARSFGPDPHLVARMGAALIEGLRSGGVAACGKHFPGHGDTDLDSHHDLPRLRHGRDRLDAVELLPFRAAIAAGVDAIMSAHVVFEAIDGERPATMSRAVIDGILRRDLGFDGAVISDDLEMKAVADRFDLGAAAVEAVRAGVDLVLCCREPARQRGVIDALAGAIERGEIPRGNVVAAHRRIDALLRRAPAQAGAADV